MPAEFLVARNAYFPFRLLVGRCQVFISDRPVGQAAPVGSAIFGRHAKVIRQEAPGHRAVNHGAAADAGRIVAVAAAQRPDNGFVTVRADGDARVALQIRPDIDAVLRQALVPQVVASDLRKCQPPTALQEQDALAGLGQQTRRHAAARSGPDNNGIVIGHPVTLNPIISHAAPSLLPPLPGSA